MAAMARGGRGAEDLVNPTGGDVSDASEPRIWCHRVGGTRASSVGVARTRASAGRPRREIRERRSAPRQYGGAEQRAAACRAGGPRVSETCDRSRRESITRFTPPVHFANGRRSVTVKVTVRGSGFGVRGVVARTPRDREPACGERTRRRERGCRLWVAGP